MYNYLREVNKSQQMPHMLAFKNPDDEFGYNIRSFLVSENFAKAFSENIKLQSKLNSLTLSKTHLSDTSLCEILSNLPLDLMKLEISFND